MVEDCAGRFTHRRGFALINSRARVVHHDDDETTGVEIVRRHIGRDVPHPERGRGHGRRNVNLAHCDDRLRLAIFGHAEVCRGQAPDRVAILVEHEDVELHDVDAAAKDGTLLLRGLLRAERKDGADRDAR